MGRDFPGHPKKLSWGGRDVQFLARQRKEAREE